MPRTYTFDAIPTTELSRMMDKQISSPVMFDAAFRQAALNELHDRARVEFDQVRLDDQSYNLTRTGRDSCDAMDTSTLGRLLELQGLAQPRGWVRALVLDELHTRALAERP